MSLASTSAFNGLIQLLALCPLLAASDTLVNGLGLGAAVLIIVPLATALLMAIRRWLSEDSALAVSLLVLATLAGCVELLMRARFPDLSASLHLFVPLIVTNIVVVARLQDREATPLASIGAALGIAIGIALTLLELGTVRELVGRGSLFHGARLVGRWASGLELMAFPVDMGFLLAMLPPGAFISLGLLIAARNWLAPGRS
jgi:H+/Na+-translocating ferredoxin:NAD+ oxidoreductase subunit E